MNIHLLVQHITMYLCKFITDKMIVHLYPTAEVACQCCDLKKHRRFLEEAQLKACFEGPAPLSEPKRLTPIFVSAL